MPVPLIYITFAVPQESRDFRRGMSVSQLRRVRIEHIGVGPPSAARHIDQLLNAERPQLVVCAGFAGGLDSRATAGSIVVAENLSTREVLAAVHRRFSGECSPIFGVVVSRGLPVESLAAKRQLASETEALAVDMESEVVAERCRAHATPVLVVRVISDSWDAPLPIPFGEWFDTVRQRPRVLRLLKYLLFHPGSIGPFCGFVRGLAPARRALAEFLFDFLSDPVGSNKGSDAPS